MFAAYLAAPVAAATFYVDGANPLASDSNSGTAGSPLKTISAAVDRFGAAGNVILVKPGIYRETVSPGASGAPGNPLVIRATGGGVTVDGSDDYSSSSHWTQVSGNVYLATAVYWSPRQVFLDGQRLALSSAEPLSLPARSYRWISGTGLYVNTGGGAPGSHSVRVGYRDHGFSLSGRSWITIEGFQVARTEDRGIYLSSASNYVTLLRNTVTSAARYGISVSGCTGDTLDANVVTDILDHGIYLASGTTGCLLRGNESARNAKLDRGVTNGIYVNASPGNRLENNRAHDNFGTGIVIYGSADRTLSIYDRAWGNAVSGFRIVSSANVRLLGDVAYGNGQQGFAIESASTSCTIQNCIATDNGLGAGGFDLMIETPALPGLASDYNVWWNSTSQAPLQLSSTAYATLADYRAASGQDAHSSQADPRFLDPAHDDFHVRAGSSAIDGANATLADWPATDAEGWPRFDDTATPNKGAGTPSFGDRGAFEFHGNYPPIAMLAVRLRPPGMITRGDTVLAVPQLSRPPYLSARTEPTFGATMRRITGDAGTSFALPTGNTGIWGSISRHHYSKNQPWSSDGGLIAIDNNGGTPIEVFLDGNTYAVSKARCSNYISGDDRWHPSPQHPRERINVIGEELMWFDVSSCIKTRSWTLPFPVNGIGPSEGNPSNDGRFLALTDGSRVFVVDMDPQPPLAPYPASRIGPAIDVSNCGLADGCAVGWASISASGKYVVVKYVNDHPRVYDVDPATLALTPHPLPAGVISCSGGDPAQGYIYDLGHPDLALDPYDDNEDVLVGQEHCGYRGKIVGGKHISGVMKVRLRDGAITPLTDPTNEAAAHHVSTRNLQRPGWAFVDYWPDPGARFNDEIVAVKLDGSLAVQRLAHKHSEFTGCYHCESHAVPSPDGQRVIWASNWAANCTTCGDLADVHSYVLDARKAYAPDANTTRSALLDASGSRDPDGTTLSYRFAFGDGGTRGPQASATTTRDYKAGTWRSSVTVSDSAGTVDSAAVTLVVPAPNLPPNGSIVSPAGDVTLVVGQRLALSASATDPDGPGPLRYLWNLGGAGPNFTTLNPGLVTFNRIGTFNVTFLVTDGLGLDDPTPATFKVIVTPTSGRAPIVTAPVTLSAFELKRIVIDVTAFDPDSDAIGALTANFSGLPAGNDAQFVTNATKTAGTFTWTPSSTSGRADPYFVTFTATNSLTGSAVTSLAVADVVGPNLVSNPSFEIGTKGWSSNGNATLSRVSGGQAGAWALQMTGPITVGMFGVNDSPNIVSATLAAGIRYRYSAWVRSPSSVATARLRVREYLGSTSVGKSKYSASVTLSPVWQRVTVDYLATQEGTTLDMQVLDDPVAPNDVFQVDNISCVIVPDPGKLVAASPEAGADSDDPSSTTGATSETGADDAAAVRLAPLQLSITPHPATVASRIRFATSRRGPVRLELLDLSGRRLRTLFEDHDAPAGIHEAALGRREAGGSRLSPGVYFWRLEAAEGVSGGRIVVLE